MKRIIAFVLVIAMMTTSLGLNTLIGDAAPNKPSVTYGGKDSFTSYEGTNYLKDATKSVYSVLPKTVTLESGSIKVTDATPRTDTILAGGTTIDNAILYDGKVDAKADLDIPQGGAVLNSTAYSAYNSAHAYYVQFTYELKTPINVNEAEFGLAFRLDKEDYKNFKYQVYVSDSYDTLYNTDLGVNGNENKVYTATFDGDGAIRYFGIRIYSLTCAIANVDSADVLRTTEWWLTGTEYTEADGPDVPDEPEGLNVTYNGNSNFTSYEGTNYLKDATKRVYSVLPKAVALESGSIKVTDATPRTDTILAGGTTIDNAILYDGKVDAKADLDLPQGGAVLNSTAYSAYNSAHAYYVQFTYELKTPIYVNEAEFGLAFRTDKEDYKDFKYQVYVSDRYDTLYDTDLGVNDKENKVYTASFGGEGIVRYFGIRIYSFTCATANVDSADVLRTTEWWLTGNEYEDMTEDLLSQENLISCTAILPDGKKTTEVKASPANDYPAANMFDGSTTSKCDLSITGTYNDYKVGYWLGTKIEDSNVVCQRKNEAKKYYVEFVFEFDFLAKPMQALFAVNNAAYAAYHYELFGAVDKETLFENSLAEIDNTQSPQQMEVTTFDNEPAIKYYGVRVYYFGTTGITDHTFRLAELQLTGEALPDEITLYGEGETYTTAMLKNEGESLIADKNFYTHLGTNATNASEEFEFPADDKYLNLTDGIVDESSTEVAVINGTPEDNSSGYCAKLVYEIDSANIYSVSKFIFSGFAANKELWTGKYEVYTAIRSEELFDGEPIFDYDYERDGYKHTAVVSFNKKAHARYIGIKILCPVSADSAKTQSYALINQMAVYGTYVERYGTTYYRVGQKFGEKDLADLGKSLISGKMPSSVLYNGANDYKIFDKIPKFWSEITNGVISRDPNKSPDLPFPDYENKLDAIYTLDEDNPYDISAFCMAASSQHQREVAQWVWPGAFEVYASLDYDELFLEENRIFDFDCERDDLAHSVVVNFEKPVRACFVAVRITRARSIEDGRNDTHARFSEIAFYGKKANIKYTEQNLIANLPVEAYFVDKKGKNSKVPSSNFTAKESVNVGDDDSTTIAVINAKKKRTDILINLCQNAKINEIQVLFASSHVPNYKVYASTDNVSVWSETSKVYAYNRVDNGVRFKKAKTMRYVRVSILAGADTISISDIKVIGLNNQLLKYKNIGTSLRAKNITCYLQDTKSGMMDYISSDDTELWFDRDLQRSFVANGAVLNKSTYNVLLNLGDLRCIREITLNYVAQYVRMHPTKVNIYVGEIQSDVFGKDVTPTCVLNKLPENGLQTLEMIPTLARYVRIEFVANNWNPKWTEKEIEAHQGDYVNREKMNIALTEVNIYGTSVVGMQNDAEKDFLLHFEDAKTGIEWDIIRIDRNDILSSVYSSKLVTYSATKKQKASLRDTNYKIDGDKLYGIEFYDITGKRITDIQERTVRVHFPVSKKLLNYNSMVGYAASDKEIELLDTECTKSPISADMQYDADKRVALTILTTEDDPYWDEVENDSNENVENEDVPMMGDSIPDIGQSVDDETSEEIVDTTEQVTDPDAAMKETVTTTKTITTKGTPTWQWILLISLSVGLLACIGAFVWLQFVMPRRKKKKEQT